MKAEKKKERPLRVAILGHKTIPSRQGGIEIVVEQLAVRMVKLGQQVTVYNRSGHHVSGKEFDEKRVNEYQGIRMKYVPTIDKKGLAAVSASFFATLYSAFGRYDVVHIHAEGRPFSVGYRNFLASVSSTRYMVWTGIAKNGAGALHPSLFVAEKKMP